MHAGSLSAGDGPTDASGADDSGGDTLLRNLRAQEQQLEQTRTRAIKAHRARIGSLEEQHTSYIGTLDEEARLLGIAIGERERGSEVAHGQAAENAKALTG